MDCYAWKIPEGCYASLDDQDLACPNVNWWWIAAAVAAGLLVFGGGKTKPRRTAARRTVRARRK